MNGVGVICFYFPYLWNFLAIHSLKRTDRYLLSNYLFSLLSGDIEDCLIQSIPQGQFTPLPEALCWIIFDLTSAGQPAVIEAIIAALTIAFPDIQRPSHDLVYDTLAKLMSEKKVSFQFTSNRARPGL